MAVTKPFKSTASVGAGKSFLRAVWLPVAVLLWLPTRGISLVWDHFFSYIVGWSLRDRYKIYRVKFVWYGDSIYLHPMIWGSAAFYSLADAGVLSTGWLLLAWFVGVFICFLTIMYNFDIIRASTLALGVAALLGGAYFSTVEFAWNPLTAVSQHVAALKADVTPGFFLASAYLFGLLIVCEVVWAWLFHRVEIDESYVYEHAFLRGSTREPIFARGMKRETKDLLELLLLGAADIQHRTKNGHKRFKNVPFASLWLGTWIDSLLDRNRNGRPAIASKTVDADDQVRISDAIHDAEDDLDGDDDFDDDDGESAG